MISSCIKKDGRSFDHPSFTWSVFRMQSMYPGIAPASTACAAYHLALKHRHVVLLKRLCGAFLQQLLRLLVHPLFNNGRVRVFGIISISFPFIRAFFSGEGVRPVCLLPQGISNVFFILEDPCNRLIRPHPFRQHRTGFFLPIEP